MTSEFNVKICKLDKLNRIKVTGLIEDGCWVALVREGEDVVIRRLDGNIVAVKRVEGNAIRLTKSEAVRLIEELGLDNSRYLALVDVGDKILIKKPTIVGW